MELPIVDLKTKKISGVKEGTPEYFHEVAHLEFNESNLGQNIQWLGDMCQIFTIIFLVCTLFYDPLKYFAFVTMIGMLFSLIYEEVWCDYKSKELK